MIKKIQNPLDFRFFIKNALFGKKNPFKKKPSTGTTLHMAFQWTSTHTGTIVKIPKCIEIASKYYKYAELWG